MMKTIFLAIFKFMVLEQSTLFDSKYVDCNLEDHFHLFQLFYYPDRNGFTRKVTTHAKGFTGSDLIRGEFH